MEYQMLTVSANQPPRFLTHHHHPKLNIPLSTCRLSWKLHAADNTTTTTTSGRGFSSSAIPNSPKKNTKNRVQGESTLKTIRHSNNPRITNQGGRKEEETVMPKVVLERMIGRILGYVGVPLVFGFATLQLIGTIKEKGILDVPMWVPFFAILVSFGGSTLGIVYGALSTSWDPDKGGSLLGFEEAASNWDEMWMEDKSDN